jgi:hypothetical protein
LFSSSRPRTERMLRLTGLRLWGRMLFGRERETEQLGAEMRDHRVPQSDEWVATCMSAEEAGCTALRAFVIPALLAEQMPIESRRNWLDSQSGARAAGGLSRRLRRR